MAEYVAASAKNSGYYVVYKDGIKISEHVSERKAHSVAVNLVIEFDDSNVYYVHEYEVKVLRTNLSFAETLPVELNLKVLALSPISIDVGETHDMSQYIVDPDNIKISSSVSGLGSIASYDSTTELLTGLLSGTASISLTVNY